MLNEDDRCCRRERRQGSDAKSIHTEGFAAWERMPIVNSA
jgi:hypothetical protein